MRQDSKTGRLSRRLQLQSFTVLLQVKDQVIFAFVALWFNGILPGVYWVRLGPLQSLFVVFVSNYNSGSPTTTIILVILRLLLTLGLTCLFQIPEEKGVLMSGS